MVMLFVSPLVLHVAVAPVTVTVDEPVIKKSLPSVAIELHAIGSVKFKTIEDGGAIDSPGGTHWHRSGVLL